MQRANGSADHHGYHCFPTFSSLSPAPFHLLEFTIISAQNLYPATRSMHTYASAWIHPDKKLSTRIDPSGHSDPSWNDKFVFRIDDAFLRSDTSAITIHLYATRSRLSPLTDHLLGVVRVILSALRPTPGTRRFVALQVRRPSSLRPYGILNLDAALLDAHTRSIPLYYDLNFSPAFAYKDLIEGREKASLTKIKEVPAEKWLKNIDNDEYKLERNGSVEMGNSLWEGEREREELKCKIEMWKAEMTPDHVLANQSSNNYQGKKKQKKIRKSSGSRILSCFCAGPLPESDDSFDKCSGEQEMKMFSE